MAAFLDLCPLTAARSGGGAGPASTQGQAGRLALIVGFTRDAWVTIQQSRRDWDFLREPFEAALAAASGQTTATALGLSDHGRWIAGRLSCVDPRSGEQRALETISYEDWARRGGASGFPQAVAIGPRDALCFAPTPDTALILRGERYRAPQRLMRDDDAPLCRPAHHDIIVHRALMSLAGFDEALSAYGAAKSEYRAMLGGLIADHTPAITMPGPLA